jgi:hypothetical protein
MPRYVNLKGSMNTFDNNRPVLSSSERLKNKRDKTIYQAEKQRFQNHKTCGNKNVRYYDNGTIRSMQGYKLQQSLARGNVLCEDCNDRGTLCGEILNKDALGSIQMGNSALSEYWGGGVLTYTPNPPTFDTIVPGWPVVVADISGTWDSSGATPTDPSKNTLPDFGYIDNLIKIPRNLDGSGIVIDPSNVLFPDELCDPFRYLQKSYLKTYLVIRGGIDIGNAMPDGAPGNQGIEDGVLGPEGCGVSWETLGGLPGPLYQYVVGAQMFLSEDVSKNGIVNGTVKSLCCIKEINMHINDQPTGTTYTNTVGIFDIYVELSYLNNMPFLSKLINYKPRYYPDNIPGGTGNNSGWDWLPLCSANSLSACSTNGAPFYFGLFNFLGNKGVFGARVAHTTYNYIESFKLIQGTIPPGLNQTKYNATKQSYMSCLEDGTRKINFTKNTVKQNNVNAAYCKYIVPPDSI